MPGLNGFSCYSQRKDSWFENGWIPDKTTMGNPFSPAIKYCCDVCVKTSWHGEAFRIHYSDVIIRAMESQISGVSIVCSIVCSGVDKKTSKLGITVLCEGNQPVSSGFLVASNAENVWIWWDHNVTDPLWWVCHRWILSQWSNNAELWCFFVVSRNQLLNKQLNQQWFETHDAHVTSL